MKQSWSWDSLEQLLNRVFEPGAMCWIQPEQDGYHIKIDFDEGTKRRRWAEARVDEAYERNR